MFTFSCILLNLSCCKALGSRPTKDLCSKAVMAIVQNEQSGRFKPPFNKVKGAVFKYLHDVTGFLYEQKIWFVIFV